MIRTVQYVLYDTVPYVRTYCNKQRTSEQKEGKRKRYRYTLRRTQTLPRLFIFCTQDVDSMVVGRGTKEEARWVLIVEKTVHTLGTRDRASFSHLTPMGLLSVGCVLYCTVLYSMYCSSTVLLSTRVCSPAVPITAANRSTLMSSGDLLSTVFIAWSQAESPSQVSQSTLGARVPTRYFMY